MNRPNTFGLCIEHANVCVQESARCHWRLRFERQVLETYSSDIVVKWTAEAYYHQLRGMSRINRSWNGGTNAVFYIMAHR